MDEKDILLNVISQQRNQALDALAQLAVKIEVLKSQQSDTEGATDAGVRETTPKP